MDGEVSSLALSKELTALAVQVGRMEARLDTKLDNFLNSHMEIKAQILSDKLESRERCKVWENRFDAALLRLDIAEDKLASYRGALVLLGGVLTVLVPTVVAIVLAVLT